MFLLNKDLEELIYRVLIKCPYYKDRETAKLISNAVIVAKMFDLKCNGPYNKT